ncbi:MAG: LCP family protein [Patescibacteria group bacterium]
MQTPKINLLPESGKSKIKLIKIIVPVVLAGIFFVGLIASRVAPRAAESVVAAPRGGIWRSLNRLLAAAERALATDSRGITHILILGTGGAGHEGPNLTDTIILATISAKEKRAGLLSIPRDLLAQTPEGQWQKINALYALTESKKPGSGGERLRTTIETIFRIEVPYYVRIDFQGFRDVVDALDGIPVDVPHAFVDPAYPTADFATRIVQFSSGEQTLTGERALEYVRSRHGTAGEGSDFARSRRQQQVLAAIMLRARSREVIGNPKRIIAFVDAVAKNMDTNIRPWEILQLASLAQEFDEKNIIRRGMDDAPDGLLQAALVDGAYVLLPKHNDFTPLAALAQNLLSEPPKPAFANTVSAARIVVRNGTGRAGFAAAWSEFLKKSGFEILETGNWADEPERTVIYDRTKGSKRRELAALQALLNAEISFDAPAGVDPKNTDFFVVLGTDAELPSP